MAEETKWAKGPWFIRERPTDDGLAVIEDGRQHGLFPITCEWSEAHLISAAPCQNEALQPLDEWARHHAIDAPEWKDSDTVQIQLSIGDLRRARDALAKAQGHSPTPGEGAGE